MPRVGGLVTTKDIIYTNKWADNHTKYIDLERVVIPKDKTIIYLGAKSVKAKFSCEIQYEYFFLHEDNVVKSMSSLLKPKKWLQKFVKVHHDQ